MRISREVKTAILVLASLLLIVFLFNYLKGQNLLDSSRKVFVIYDNTEGLTSSNPVTLNGNSIGKVQNISFTKDGSAKILVQLVIENSIDISINSKAEIYDTGIIGGKGVRILPAFDGEKNIVSGDMLEGSVKLSLVDMFGKTLTPLEKKLSMILINADSLLININQIFDNETKGNLKKGISELSTTISSFKQTSTAINQLIEVNKNKLENTLTNVEDISSNLSVFTDSIAKINLSKTMNQLQETIGTMNNVISGLESGKGSMGKLLNDDGLYDNLEGATKQIEALLSDMRLNPKRYVHFSLFGKKTKIYDADGNVIKEQKK
ncbi:MlaD family protein [Flavobacteriaceae bacterium]|nr:MlaD family protein [Flavobacteriaceae bacterium]